MSAIHETAYPRIKPYLNNDELQTLFMPTPEELLLLNRHTKKTLPVSRLGFMVFLKCYQYLGRPVKAAKIDLAIKKYIAESIEIDPAIDLKGYPKLTRTRHLKIIRAYLNVNANKKDRRKIIKASALNAATTKENLADIINVIIEELIKSKFELPAFQRLVRVARAARNVVNNRNYLEIVQQLSLKQKQIIDNLFSLENMVVGNDVLQPEKPLTWVFLKQQAKKPTKNNIREYVSYVNQLKAIRQRLNVDINFVTPARLEQLRDEAVAADKDDMIRMRSVKRYALSIIFIHLKTASSIDDLVHIFIGWIRQIEKMGKEALEVYRCKHANETDEMILKFYHMLLAIKHNKTDREKITAIEKNLGGKTDTLITQCEEHLGLTGENHIIWMLKPYKNKRYVIFKTLENLTVFSSTKDKSLENGLRFIMHYHHSHKEWIILKEGIGPQPDFSFLSDAWFKAVTGFHKSENMGIKKINRHCYEMAVMAVLMIDLNCSDAYVDGAFIYDDPNNQFISWEEFESEVDPYCVLTKLEKEPNKFIETIQLRLRKIAKKIDEFYPHNPYWVINKGLPILKKLPAKKEYPDFEKTQKIIMAEMPLTTIVDVIIDVENWLNLSVYFKPLSGNETRIPDYSSRFVATTLSYGANVGPTQAERSLLKYTRKQIAWLFNHHVTSQKLIKAVKKIINKFKLFDLPKYWGPGDSASVDGTFLDVYKQNLLAAHHIRYGRYGGIGYYHVSDQYIALFSNFISCGVHESIYLLDGIVENDSDIQPRKVHGDSWAQSEVLFGVASLLAIQIMPRIKQFKDLYYYKVSSDDHYQHIDELFTEKSIDWELIVTHYLDMLRVVLSIHKGKVKASTVLRKLCSKSRKNKLYFAFRELGRVERTIFLLNYIHDPALRKMIQAATCKSEEFNEFIKWISFGDGGVIGDNLQFNQEKIVRFSHLLANMVIFYNMVHQTKAINKLKTQGIEVPEEILSGISPYWREHINRLGVFQLDMNKDSAEMEYGLNGKSKI